MNAGSLLEALRQQGVEFSLCAGRLRWRARKGVLNPQILQQMKLHRDDLIAALSGDCDQPATPVPLPSDTGATPPLPEWDGFEADAVLIRLNSLFDAVGRCPLTPSQMNVLAVVKQTAKDLHAKQDPLFFDMASDGGLETIFRRWGVPEEILTTWNKARMVLIATNLRCR